MGNFPGIMHQVFEAEERTRTRALALIGVVFFVSGFATLVYQVAWQRLLTLYYGVGPVSIAVIVSVFLLGLGIGGLLGGWLAERIPRLALLYSLIEVGLGLYGIASVPFLDLLGRTTAGSSYLWTAFFSALFLLPPTVLMGATLPVVLKLYNRRTGQYLESLSFLYFINTLGAATGALVAGYVLISLFDLDGAIGTAVFLKFRLGNGRLPRDAQGRSDARRADCRGAGQGTARPRCDLAGLRHRLRCHRLRDCLGAQHQQHSQVVAVHVRNHPVRVSAGDCARQLRHEPHRAPPERRPGPLVVLPAAGPGGDHSLASGRHLQVAGALHFPRAAGHHHRRQRDAPPGAVLRRHVGRILGHLG